MLKAISFLFLAAVAQELFAAETPSDPASVEAQFATRVHARFPGTDTAAIAPAFAGFHSIVKDGEVLFIRDDLSVLISGNVVDLASNRSITSEVKARNPRRVDVSKLDLKDAIRFGQGKKRLYVFSDPDCPYCKTLQSELDKLHGVEVYVFPFPLAPLHPGARDVATSIWCQSDRAAAWDNYVVRRTSPQPNTCATPIDRNLAIGGQFGIRATPTLVFPDGAIVEGAEQAERIEAQLAEATK